MGLLEEPSIYNKLQLIEAECHSALLGQQKIMAPLHPARDIEVTIPSKHPPKKGISEVEGQARLLHDLASIELQAMELGLRTLHEFPEAHQDFREQLVSIVLDEARHLRLCLEGLEVLGFKWGSWPCHTYLWQATSQQDSLLDRILIVHRYLEGSGLDASDKIIKRLNTSGTQIVEKAVKVIADEELGHVQFGSHWYHEFCKEQKVDSDSDFKQRFESIKNRLPRRAERINTALRKKAGFTSVEIDVLENYRQSLI